MAYVQVIPVVRKGTEGDFEVMILDPENANALFLFNDNEEDQYTANQGSGSSAVRPHNKYGSLYPKDRPKSLGIPTASKLTGGYTELNLTVRRRILAALAEMRELILSGGYRKVYYAADPADGFSFAVRRGVTVNPEVVEYITKLIPYYCGQMDGSMY